MTLHSDLLQAQATASSTNLADNDHIKYDTVVLQDGTAIELDITSPYTNANNQPSVGRFLLKANRTYLLKATPNLPRFSGSTGLLDFAWFNADDGTQIGRPARAIPPTHANNDAANTTVETLFRPTVDTRVEVRYIDAVVMTSMGHAPTGLLPTAIIIEVP